MLIEHIKYKFILQKKVHPDVLKFFVTFLLYLELVLTYAGSEVELCLRARTKSLIIFIDFSRPCFFPSAFRLSNVSDI